MAAGKAFNVKANRNKFKSLEVGKAGMPPLFSGPRFRMHLVELLRIN
jgi:hypothetical protein